MGLNVLTSILLRFCVKEENSFGLRGVREDRMGNGREGWGRKWEIV